MGLTSIARTFFAMKPTHVLIRTAALCAALLGSAKADTANTQEVVTAANAFMALLTTAQKTAIDSTSSPVNSSCLYNATLSNVEVWSNLPVSTSLSGATRNGLIFSSLTTAQKEAALAVATAALGTTGKKLLDDVRAADRYISGEVTNAKGTTSSGWGYNKYFIAFIGVPSTTTPWTFQFGGHHLAYNITYNGTYPSSTPMFVGTEPNSWTDSTGTYAPMGTQRSLLTQLRPTLTSTGAASGGPLLSGTYSDVVFGPNGSGPGATSGHDTTQPKVYPTTSRGQLYSSLTSAQQALVKGYIETWVNTQASVNAAELLSIYESPQALAETYIGYSGSSTTLAQNASYFRVDGPRLWIEFIVQTGVYDMSGVHDHGVWRDKLTDYGASYGSTTVATTLRPPVISAQPASLTRNTGTSATFSVTAASAGTGTATLSYQWYKDSAAISGATGTSYTLSSVASGDTGSYAVKIISTGGLVTSSTATLSISAPAVAISTSSPLTAGVVGVAYSQTFTASGGTSPYIWSLGSGILPGGLTLGTGGVLGGTPTTAGTFNFNVTATDSASASATSAFALTIREPLDLFLEEYGLSDATADEDGDGVSNLLEFFLGGDPTSSDSSILPSAVIDTDTAVFTYSFEIREIEGSVTWKVQYSSDLETWTDAADGSDGISIDESTASGGLQAVTVTIPAGGEKLFARLVVTLP